MEVEERVAKLEKVVEHEDRIGRVERIGIRLGMLIIVLLTLLVIILTKCSDVVHALTSLVNATK